MLLVEEDNCLVQSISVPQPKVCLRMIHISSVIEWTGAMILMWQYAGVTGISIPVTQEAQHSTAITVQTSNEGYCILHFLMGERAISFWQRKTLNDCLSCALGHSWDCRIRMMH